jgi:hypothetical protein
MAIATRAITPLLGGRNVPSRARKSIYPRPRARKNKIAFSNVRARSAGAENQEVSERSLTERAFANGVSAHSVRE